MSPSDVSMNGGFDIHQENARIGAEHLWAKMRDAPGLTHFDNYGGYYVVTRFEDVMRVLMAPTLFSSAAGITLPQTAVRSRHIPAETDPPEHREYRALMAPLMSAPRVRVMEPAVRGLVIELLDGIDDEVPIDFVRAFARPLPVNVALDFLGLPRSDAALLETLVGELHQEVATGIKSGAADRLTQSVERVIAERQPYVTDPEQDVMSSILLGQVFSRSLSFDEQVSMVRLFLVGGFDSTSIALSTAVWWLAQHPEDRQRLRDDPSLIDSMSEDVVRFASPATYLRRVVTEDTELSGQPLRKGDQVLVCFGAANRDPSQFEDPDTIKLDRKRNRHVGFGAGHHRCVGSFIAKLELKVALEEILSRFTSFRVDDRRPIEFTTGLNQGIISLPMIFSRET